MGWAVCDGQRCEFFGASVTVPQSQRYEEPGPEMASICPGLLYRGGEQGTQLASWLATVRTDVDDVAIPRRVGCRWCRPGRTERTRGGRGVSRKNNEGMVHTGRPRDKECDAEVVRREVGLSRGLTVWLELGVERESSGQVPASLALGRMVASQRHCRSGLARQVVL